MLLTNRAGQRCTPSELTGTDQLLLNSTFNIFQGIDDKLQ
jgi:hypothetical protein